MGGGGGWEEGMEKVEGGSEIEGCWVKIGECGSGNLHWVKLWEAEEEEDSESGSKVRRECGGGGGWSEAEGREGRAGEWEAVGLKTERVQWPKNPQEKS